MGKIFSEHPKQLERIAYSLHEVGAMLGLTYPSIYKLARDGRLPARRVGGAWRVLKGDLETSLGIGVNDEN